MVEISSDGDFVFMVVFIIPKNEKESGNGENRLHFFFAIDSGGRITPRERGNAARERHKEALTL
tara:strand:+ start:294 stop:485 length:192 start_codon:yes stop_codon:yes gene_type:complete